MRTEKNQRLRELQGEHETKRTIVAEGPIPGTYKVIASEEFKRDTIFWIAPGYFLPGGSEGEVKAIIQYPKDANESTEEFSLPPVSLEPWRRSRPYQRERDKIIWESRQEGYTWEQIAELADCGITTAKEVYKRLEKRLKSG